MATLTRKMKRGSYPPYACPRRCGASRAFSLRRLGALLGNEFELNQQITRVLPARVRVLGQTGRDEMFEQRG